MFMPWQTKAVDGATESVQGISVNDGQLVLVAGLVTVGLIQVGWRPAWIGAGFASAVTIRRILDGDADAAVGLWTAAVFCVLAAVLLVWDLFANVSAAGDAAGEGVDGARGPSGSPRSRRGRGLSGPLGRRRR